MRERENKKRIRGEVLSQLKRNLKFQFGQPTIESSSSRKPTIRGNCSSIVHTTTIEKEFEVAIRSCGAYEATAELRNLYEFVGSLFINKGGKEGEQETGDVFLGRDKTTDRRTVTKTRLVEVGLGGGVDQQQGGEADHRGAAVQSLGGGVEHAEGSAVARVAHGDQGPGDHK